ncbi:hypothetical protein NP493_153g07007 [Ridgeia piscesae]|uniref:Uncharacterized protein n=1 Tax=Ridgeia piscesae TaxID=27915 RepID=A0AAD9P474_RIDPI|nr:hypothetical protein NP493_153g07007 [Ridgeia piscesae]
MVGLSGLSIVSLGVSCADIFTIDEDDHSFVDAGVDTLGVVTPEVATERRLGALSTKAKGGTTVKVPSDDRL